MAAAALPPAPPPSAARPPRRRVRTPTVLQMEAVECGAAVLGIVLGHYGRIVPLEELRQECGVSRDGSKASNILKAARRYGMEASGRKYEHSQDLYDLEFPVILFWNLNHFVVLEGFRGGMAYINDPAQGPRRVTLEELDACFSGVVLTLRPGPAFERGGARPSTLRSLRRRLVESKLALVYLILCGLLLVVPGLVMPTFARVFVDEYLVAGRGSVVRPLLLAMAVTAAVMMVLTWLQRYYLLRLETKLSLLHSSRFFAHIQRLPLPYFVQRYAGEIGARLAINDRVASVVAGTLTTIVLDLFVLVFYLALMLWYDVTLTAVVVGVAALNVLAVKVVARMRADSARRLLQDRGKLQGTAMGGLSMIETLKATGGEAEFFGRWAGHHAKCLLAEQRLALVSETTSLVPFAIAGVTTAAVYVIGGLKVIDGEMTIGMLVAYQTLVASFTRPLGDLVESGGVLQELPGDLARLDDVLRHQQDARYRRPAAEGVDDPGAVKLAGRVELRDVTFGYSPLEPPLLEGFHLSVEPGQRLAIVGSSGSGKSTVAKLVAGLYEPWHGEVLLDGTPRQHLPPRLVVDSLGVVDQDVFLFGGTIGENVAMWDKTLPPARIVAACRDAAIHDVVAGREGGYEAVLEEGGKNLSGGQRQRLEIARALAGDPTVLVLDEATSALDPVTEAQIDEALRRRGCTCIIVAHRLSTVRDADAIVVLERGRIVQQGTHDEMKDVDGPYRELISLA